jgi:hypothetical protein
MANFKESIAKTGVFLVNNKKPLLYVGGAVVLVVLGYAIVSRTKKGIDRIFTDKSKGETPFTEAEVDVTKTTISDSLANTFANQLYSAMKNSGTNEDMIYSIFKKIEKKDDFRKVYNAFGRRSYVGKFVGGSPTALDKWLGNYDDFDLIEWLNEEVGYSNYPTYSLVKKVVTNAGYVFG